MKHYLIFLFTALFGIGQIVQAANPNEVKKGKKAAPVVRQAPHVNRAPAAFRKSTNNSARVIGAPVRHQGNVQFQNNRRTLTARHAVNPHLQKTFDDHNAAVAAKVTRRNQNNVNNAAAAAQLARRNQNNANNAAALEQLARHNHNTGNVGVQRNWQNRNRDGVGNGKRRSDWNRNWSGLSFAEASRRHHRQHHDRNWWRHHYGTNIILFGSGYYYRDAGYWYPAYGYDPAYSTYEYDGPIYGYNDLPPNQVLTNVQNALQQQGYYRGEIDGSIGPLTRSALRSYQRDNGLEITGAVDEPTLATLGLV